MARCGAFEIGQDRSPFDDQVSLTNLNASLDESDSSEESSDDDRPIEEDQATRDARCESFMRGKFGDLRVKICRD